MADVISLLGSSPFIQSMPWVQPIDNDQVDKRCFEQQLRGFGGYPARRKHDGWSALVHIKEEQHNQGVDQHTKNPQPAAANKNQ